MSQFLINTVTELQNAVQVLLKADRLSHDTETKGPPEIGGLFPFHGSRSFSHIIASATDEYYFNFNVGGINPEHKKLLQPLFNDPNRLWFYVNAVFDNCIMHFDGLKNHGRIFDCPSIARVEYNMHDPAGRTYLNNDDDGSFLSLAYLASHYQVQLKDDRVKKYIEENNLYGEKPCKFDGSKIPLYDLVPLQLMFEYGCGDARSTFDLGQKIIQCINHKDENLFTSSRGNAGLLMDVARSESALTPVLIDMKIDGMKINKEYCEKVISEGEIELQRLTSEVQELTGGINLNSGKQLAEFLLSKGIELPRKEPTETMLLRSKAWAEKAEIARLANKTKHYEEALKKALEYSKGNYTTDSKQLAKVLEANPDMDFLSKLSKAKKLDKKINTYFKNFLLFADANGYIHANLNQEKAITGRFSSSSPNLQNLHKEKWEKDCGLTREEWKKLNPNLVRSAFINDDPDFDLFFMDYDQQEMMVMLDQAEELAIIQKLIDKIYDDFYLATGAVLLEVGGIKITRQQAKAVALGLAYGEGVMKLSKGLGMTPDKTKAFIDDFFRVLPQLKKLKNRLERSVKWYGRIHNPFGRVSYINKNDSYKALNSFVQGTSADITKRAMVACHGLLKPYKSKLLLCVHDELIFKIHKSERHLIPELQKLMSEAYPHKHIPLTTGVEWSASDWGDKNDYEAEVA